MAQSYRHTMLLLPLCVLVLASCAAMGFHSYRDFPVDPVAERITPALLAQYPLTYEKLVQDRTGTPFLKITYTYKGRKPDDPQYYGPDYNYLRTCFYDVRYENLTAHSIHWRRASHRQHFLKTMTLWQTDRQGRKDVRAVQAERTTNLEGKSVRWGDTWAGHLPGNAGRTVESFCYSDKGEIFFTDVTVAYQGDDYTYTLHKVAH